MQFHDIVKLLFAIYFVKCTIYRSVLPADEYGQNNLVVTVFGGGPTNGGLSVT